MRNLRVTTIAMITVLLGLFSCGSDNNDPTKREMVVQALQGNWGINDASSVYGSDVDGSGSGATFTETTFSLSGAVASYASGGSYTITEEGTFSDVTITLVPDNIALSGNPGITINNDLNTITVSFETVEAGGRLAGLGSWSLVFDK